MGKIRFTKLDERATIPSKGTPGAAGLDLYPIKTLVLAPNCRRAFKTGLSVQIPPGCYGRIASRSGNAFKYGIEVGAGVIDSDYRGEINVILIHTGTTFVLDKQSGAEVQAPEDFVAVPNKAIAQLILEKIDDEPEIEVVEFEDLSTTERGEGGFGSTDKEVTSDDS